MSNTPAPPRITIQIIIRFILLGAIIIGVGYVVTEKPPIVSFIEQKIQSIHIPNRIGLVGSLSPARDLRGTWTSSIQGKGIQLYGQFNTAPGMTYIYETGDVELIIDDMSGSVASGTIRYMNECTTGETTVPGYGNIVVPKQCVADSGWQQIRINVSSSHVDFGTIRTAQATLSMQGNYTTDIMSGTIITTTPYGDIKGTFNLTRRHN